MAGPDLQAVASTAGLPGQRRGAIDTGLGEPPTGARDAAVKRVEQSGTAPSD